MPNGLEALIPQKKNKNKPPRKESIFWVEISKVKPNPLQPRKIFNKKELQDLASSIEKYGILQPMIVKKIEKDTASGENIEYQLIAGERRLKAAGIVGMREVPIIVEEIKKEDELPISLVENIQREDLNPIEKARSFLELTEKSGLTQREVGQIIGKSREAVSNTIRLLELPDKIIESIEGGDLSEGHARALLSIKENYRMKVFKEIIDKKLPVREVEKKGKRKIGLKGKAKVYYNPKLEKEILKKTKLSNFRLNRTNGKIDLKLIFKSEKELKDFLKKIK